MLSLSRRNLTYKSVALLVWATSRCPNATFVAKVDDDVLVNPFHLRTFFEKQLEQPPQPKVVSPQEPLDRGWWSGGMGQGSHCTSGAPSLTMGSSLVPVKYG